ncbi:DDE-type integrase/transposase/recombinase [Micromonospora sp. CA-259024]|uniref:DDE-type integrase/transposase/recombinase n=1 Tax=Micromonospora sp. CA-259024 TaxID=3239965 RepID=UPI003D90FBBA
MSVRHVVVHERSGPSGATRFTADAPNRVWPTDITEHPTAEGLRYLCAIKGVHSGRIGGYSIDTRMKASPAVTTLRNAVRLRDPAKALVPSDRGSQSRSRNFVKAWHRSGLINSMGRASACGDAERTSKSVLAGGGRSVDRPSRAFIRLVVVWVPPAP